MIEETEKSKKEKIIAFKKKLELNEKIEEMMKNGKNVDAYKNISKSYKGLKKYDKAINTLQKAKTMCQFDPEIYYELGINYLLDKQNNEARKNFIRTIKLDKSNINAQIQLGISHELLDEEFMAIAIYKKVIEENPNYILAYNHLATLYIDLEDYNSALCIFAEVIKNNPKYYRAYLGIGICYDKLQNYNKAIRFYKRYIAKKPNSKTSHALVNRILDIYKIKKTHHENLSLISA